MDGVASRSGSPHPRQPLVGPPHPIPYPASRVRAHSHSPFDSRYLSFNPALYTQTLAQLVNTPCGWAPGVNASLSQTGMTIGGEYSAASNDCGYWLNGPSSASFRRKGTQADRLATCSSFPSARHSSRRRQQLLLPRLDLRRRRSRLVLGQLPRVDARADPARQEPRDEQHGRPLERREHLLDVEDRSQLRARLRW